MLINTIYMYVRICLTPYILHTKFSLWPRQSSLITLLLFSTPHTCCGMFVSLLHESAVALQLPRKNATFPSVFLPSSSSCSFSSLSSLTASMRRIWEVGVVEATLGLTSISPADHSDPSLFVIVIDAENSWLAVSLFWVVSGPFSVRVRCAGPCSSMGSARVCTSTLVVGARTLRSSFCVRGFRWLRLRQWASTTNQSPIPISAATAALTQDDITIIGVWSPWLPPWVLFFLLPAVAGNGGCDIVVNYITFYYVAINDITIISLVMLH